MHNKKLIIIVLVVIIITALGFWFRITRSEPKETLVKNSVSITKAIDTKEEIKIKKESPQTSENIASKKDEESNNNDDVMYELSQQQFSEEPVVELLSILAMGESCQRMNYYELNYEETKFSQKAHLLLAKNKQDCQTLLETYPQIGSEYNKSNKGRMLILKLASESHYLDFVQKAMGVKYMDNEAKNLFIAEMFAHVLKSQSAPLISQLQIMSREKEMQTYMNRLATILGTVNSSYTQQILQQATVLYACQYNQSITCSPSSQYMLEQCIGYEQACGLDVPTWFELNHTKAHNRDIAKMIRYFEGL
jgi:uncharacterized protein YxeA